MFKVLIVEEDTELVALLKGYLERDGFGVEAVRDGASGVTRALSGAYQVAVMDIALPVKDGIEALRSIRMQSDVPILMLTAKGDDTDKIIGLELGADDCVSKGCTPREVSARLRAIMRRTVDRPPTDPVRTVLTLGAFTLWPQRRQVDYAGKAIDFTSTEFNLLESLTRNACKVVSKRALCEEALGRTLTPYDRSLDVHVSRIRAKLKAATNERIQIKTVHSVGYQIVAT
jgi:DNA-binding response OmpR family regulator